MKALLKYLRTRNIVFATILLSSVSTAGHAEVSPATATLIDLSIRKKTGQAHGELLAQTAALYCEEIQTAYPRNSPAEEAWLSEEVNSGGDRTIRALGTAEFGRRKAAQFTDACRAWATAVRDDPALNQNYVGLALTFLRFSQDAEFYAQKNQIRSEPFGFQFILDDIVESFLLISLSLGE